MRGMRRVQVWLGIGIHACGDNGDQVVAGLMGDGVGNG